MSDSRYTIEKEFCGHSEARYVVRFCGEFIGSFANRLEATVRASCHSMKRKERLS